MRYIARTARYEEKTILHRFISAAAFAAFVALGMQSAFADTMSPGAATTPAPAVSDAAAHAVPGAQRSASTAAIAGSRTARVRRAARIPGTFAVSETPSDNDVREEQYRLRVLFPALSGDGGG
jgi:hypothetical protein